MKNDRPYWTSTNTNWIVANCNAIEHFVSLGDVTASASCDRHSATGRAQTAGTAADHNCPESTLPKAELVSSGLNEAERSLS